MINVYTTYSADKEKIRLEKYSLIANLSMKINNLNIDIFEERELFRDIYIRHQKKQLYLKGFND
jgi:hypothetical protein